MPLENVQNPHGYDIFGTSRTKVENPHGYGILQNVQKDETPPNTNTSNPKDKTSYFNPQTCKEL